MLTATPRLHRVAVHFLNADRNHSIAPARMSNLTNPFGQCYTLVSSADPPNHENEILPMRRMPSYPDLILHNARIYTVEPDLPWASAVALRRGVIVAVGDSAGVLSLAGPQTEMLDLQGRFECSPACAMRTSTSSTGVATCPKSTRRPRVVSQRCSTASPLMLNACQRTRIVGQGWNESWWGDTDFPTTTDLRTATGPQQPAIFWRSDMHGAVVNDRALELAGITAGTPNPKGGVIDKDANGRPTGVLRELAIRLVSGLIPSPTPDEIAPALQFGVSRLHTLGITAIHDQRMKATMTDPKRSPPTSA